MAPSATVSTTVSTLTERKAASSSLASTATPVTASQSGHKTPGHKLGGPDRQDFFWSYTEEPHATRRKAIIQAHPEVLKLCGPEPSTKWHVLGVVALQVAIASAFSFYDIPFCSITFLATAYIVGATANQNLFLAIHEISHNLAFKSPAWNRALAIVANLPIGIPYSASFRPYHLTHHKSLGVDQLDVDIPTSFEAVFLNSVAGKAFFCTFQLLFYALRPMFVLQLPIGPLHLANIAVQVVFDLILIKTVGYKALGYLILSSFLAGSLHPVAGHFIAEHYVFEGAGTKRNPRSLSLGLSAEQKKREAAGRMKLPVDAPPPAETYSYYGALNLVTYNVGYHNEHHDFPAIPWTRLPKLHSVAKEYYEDLPCHGSWAAVIWYFIVDDRVGLWSRVKRETGGRAVGGINGLKQNDIGE